MPLPNIFTQEITNGIIARINNLTNSSTAKWGKMTVDQMLAHCNVTYEMIYDDIHQKPNFFVMFILKLFVKNKVVNDTAYGQNSPTAPAFIIKNAHDFEKQKVRLIAYLKKTQELGEQNFDQKESHSFGKLSKDEWNNMFYKHLDHHLSQFGS